jgi:dihydroorotate dehydrogenase electron transfer subunit
MRAVQETARVLRLAKAGEYHELALVAPRIAELVQPGQFVQVKTTGIGQLPTAGPGCFMLRRPFSVHLADPGAGRAGHGTISIVFEVIGPGTSALAGARVHDHLDLVGPLGTAWTPPPEPAPCLLVGGGYGAAPLFLLAERLRAAGCRVDMVLGAATAGRLLKPLDAKRHVATLALTTDDGSQGTRGQVTDVLGPGLARVSQAGGIVYACGPMPMLAAVAQAASAAGVRSQVAVEERMACGTGICFSCVVPVVGGAMARSCTDGPVFDGATVAWAELGLGAHASPGREELVP